MPINCSDLKNNVIIPTLNHLNNIKNSDADFSVNYCSESAINLILGTAAQESHLGTYLKQIGGPAIGIYQVEKVTHEDILCNFLNFNNGLSGIKLQKRIELQENVYDLLIPGLGMDLQLMGNLYYATAICRCHYLRFDEPLPSPDDIRGLAIYWKKYYNTALGSGTIEEFIKNYECYVK